MINDRAFRVIQVSDCHLGKHGDFVLAGINTKDSFQWVLDTIKQTESPDLLVATGDLAGDHEPEAYEQFNLMMDATGLPMAWLPGNHDDFVAMQPLLKTPFARTLDMGDWLGIFLNSAVPGQVGGALAHSELATLGALLKQYPDRHTALFLHHPPVAINSAWLDEHRVSNHFDFAAVLQQHPQVKGIFAGHVHQAVNTTWYGCTVHTAPSTCFQFEHNRDSFALSNEPPGYRWINFNADGSITSGVSFVQGYKQTVDRQCVGY